MHRSQSLIGVSSGWVSLQHCRLHRGTIVSSSCHCFARVSKAGHGSPHGVGFGHQPTTYESMAPGGVVTWPGSECRISRLAARGPSSPLCALAPVDFKLVSNAKAESWELFTAGNIRSGLTAWRWPPGHGRLYRSTPGHAAQHTSQLGPSGTHFLPSIVHNAMPGFPCTVIPGTSLIT